MDVHAGNIVHGEAGLRLIDWEYAGDGDVALELAAGVDRAAAHRRQPQNTRDGRASMSLSSGKFSAGVRGCSC